MVDIAKDGTAGVSKYLCRDQNSNLRTEGVAPLKHEARLKVGMDNILFVITNFSVVPPMKFCNDKTRSVFVIFIHLYTQIENS